MTMAATGMEITVLAKFHITFKQWQYTSVSLFYIKNNIIEYNFYLSNSYFDLLSYVKICIAMI